MGDLALLLKVPTGQLRKTSKSMDESRKENRLLAVIGMMAHAHSKSCLAIPEALGLWLRNKGVPVDVRVGLNRFGFSCSPDHVQDILEKNGEEAASNSRKEDVMKDVALWFGLVQVDNWDHDLAVQNLFLQKKKTSVHGSILTAYRFQNQHVAKGLDFEKPHVSWADLGLKQAQFSTIEATVWREHLYHLIETVLKLYAAEKKWKMKDRLFPAPPSPTPLSETQRILLEIDPSLGFARTADFVTLCQKVDKLFTSSDYTPLQPLLESIINELKLASPEDGEFIDRYASAALDLCLLKWRAIIGGDGALNKGLNSARNLTATDPLAPVEGHPVSAGWLHIQQAAYAATLEYCEPLMRKLHLALARRPLIRPPSRHGPGPTQPG